MKVEAKGLASGTNPRLALVQALLGIRIEDWNRFQTFNEVGANPPGQQNPSQLSGSNGTGDWSVVSVTLAAAPHFMIRARSSFLPLLCNFLPFCHFLFPFSPLYLYLRILTALEPREPPFLIETIPPGQRTQVQGLWASLRLQSQLLAAVYPAFV